MIAIAALASIDVSEWEMIGRLGAATGLAACLGLQRELAGHDAGVRTHALLALGAALFGVISVGAFARYVDSPSATNVQIDITRIASYVAAGVGFLAGGVIVKHRDRVQGLTTASSLWVASAVGLACGLGAYLVAVVATAITVIALALDGPITRTLGGRRRQAALLVEVTGDGVERLSWLRERLQSHARPPSCNVSRDSEATTIVVRGITSDDAHRVAEEAALWPDLRRCDVDTG